MFRNPFGSVKVEFHPFLILGKNFSRFLKVGVSLISSPVQRNCNCIVNHLKFCPHPLYLPCNPLPERWIYVKFISYHGDQMLLVIRPKFSLTSTFILECLKLYRNVSSLQLFYIWYFVINTIGTAIGASIPDKRDPG